MLSYLKLLLRMVGVYDLLCILPQHQVLDKVVHVDHGSRLLNGELTPGIGSVDTVCYARIL